MRDRTDIERAIEAHGDTVWRVCVLYFRQGPDAQDAFQETIIKYASYDGAFNDTEHCKAWLIRVATNVCKDMLKAAHRTRAVLDDGTIAQAAVSCDESSQPGSASGEVLDAMLSLTDPPRTPVYLSLYEGYSAPEIADLLDAPVNTVYSWISRGKKLLKEALA
ncbi:RNA polymerase sigma factor [Raoultibacter phocaeensis]|uniref:RNA polymerase sigma factor n=1 Tax=Raoultibacter phocaeensis TaxID=2479841 RepID=UPI0015D5B772|nr:RNA polymerase sigma factor [Raoultibacter phocaeensis]